MLYMDFNLTYILSLLVRGSLLGGIVFASATFIPSNPPTFRNRLIMSAAVVLIYALLDYIQTFLITVRNVACDVVCGPRSGATAGNIGDLDLDLKDIKDLAKDL